MKFKVQGGTHLGITGAYGERIFNVNSIEDIEKIIRNEQGLQEAEKSSYKTRNGTVIHCLVNREGLTLFEYRILERDNK